MSHRRSKSEGHALLDQQQHDLIDLPPELQAQLQGMAGPGPGPFQQHSRTVSLDTSCASHFMQSLQLHDAAGLQQLMQPGDQAAAHDQQHAAAAAAAAAAADWPAAEPALAAGSKRAHDSNGRTSKDSDGGKKESGHQHKSSFTPALPVVDEAGDAAAAGAAAAAAGGRPSAKERRTSVHWDDDDEDYDSGNDGFNPAGSRRTSSGGRGRARRGGYNGRSENELMLLDPKRVKRILANRQSAARSKERRMGYTMQLESKLQSLAAEMDKLNSQLDGLQGHSKLLVKARAELDQQVGSLQLQLSQTAADNQLLMSELFGLQSVLGLPQLLPEPDAAALASAGAAVQPYGSTASSWPCAAPAGASQLPGGDGTAAAGRQGAIARGSAAAAAAGAAGVGAVHAGAVAGMPPLPPHARSPVAQVSPTISHAQAAGTTNVSPAAGAAAGAAIAAAMAPLPGAAAGGPSDPGGTVVAAAVAGAAAEALLLDQMPAGSAALGGDEDLYMLEALLADAPMAAGSNNGSPMGQPPLAAGAGAGAAGVNGMLAAPPPQLAVPPHGPAAAAAAAAAMDLCGPAAGEDPAALAARARPRRSSAGAAAASPRGAPPAAGAAAPYGSSLTVTPGHGALPSQAGVFGAGAGVHPNWAGRCSSAVHAGGGAAAGVGGFGKTSPAYSDPMGVEAWHDELSSGSLAGSLTPNTASSRHPRTSDGSSRAAVAGPQGAALRPLGAWQQPHQLQQHPQQQEQQQVGLTRRASSADSAPFAAAAAGGTSASAAAAGMAGAQHHRAHVSWDLQAANAAAMALEPNAMSGGSGFHNYHQQLQQQQQQQLGMLPQHAPGMHAAAGGGLPAADHVNFTMGANPAAAHRFSSSHGISMHHRSASAGSMLGFVDGADRSWAAMATTQQQSQHQQYLQQQQQQQQQQHQQQHPGYLPSPASSGALAALAAGEHGHTSPFEAPAALQQQQQVVVRQHRRSHSHAGAFAASTGRDLTYVQWQQQQVQQVQQVQYQQHQQQLQYQFQQQQQHHHQQQHHQQAAGPSIHPAALGRGAAAADYSMPVLPGVPVSSSRLSCPGNGMGGMAPH